MSANGGCPYEVNLVALSMDVKIYTVNEERELEHQEGVRGRIEWK
jgi:hypothetical protein